MGECHRKPDYWHWPYIAFAGAFVIELFRTIRTSQILVVAANNVWHLPTESIYYAISETFSAFLWSMLLAFAVTSKRLREREGQWEGFAALAVAGLALSIAIFPAGLLAGMLVASVSLFVLTILLVALQNLTPEEPLQPERYRWDIVQAGAWGLGFGYGLGLGVSSSLSLGLVAFLLLAFVLSVLLHFAHRIGQRIGQPRGKAAPSLTQ